MRCLSVCTLIIAFSLPGAALAKEDPVAVFNKVSGSASVTRAKTNIVAVAGTRLMGTDVVSTGPRSSAGIVFKDGTQLTLGESAEVEISRYLFKPDDAKYDFSLYLRKGSAIYASGKLGKLAPEAVDLRTPRAAIGIRGTRFIIKAE